jgi:arylsulfatase A-like enzyme
VGVPIVFLGPGIRPQRIRRPVRTVDIGPTLAALLGVTPTEPLDGRVLPEIAGAAARR